MTAETGLVREMFWLGQITGSLHSNLSFRGRFRYRNDPVHWYAPIGDGRAYPDECADDKAAPPNPFTACAA
jgi:hypothetical protein